MEAELKYSIKQPESWRWACWIFCMAYLVRLLDMPMTLADEAQQADYLKAMLVGIYPFRDFIDIYGPLNWFLPLFAFWFGDELWIVVRLWVLCVHGLSLWLVQSFLLQRVNGLYANLATVGIALIFGIPWAIHYSPYAFIHLYPVILGIMICLVPKPYQHGYTGSNIVIAGILIGIAIFIKINSGLFLLTGALWILGYGHVEKPSQQYFMQHSLQLPWLFLLTFITGIIVLLGVYTGFIYEHFDRGYWFHLSLPLWAMVAGSIWYEWYRFRSWDSDSYCRGALRRLKQLLTLFLSVAISCFVLLAVFYPSGITPAFIEQIPKLLTSIDYYKPFPTLGVSYYHNPGIHAWVSWGWPQLSWGVSLWVLLLFILRRAAISALLCAYMLALLNHHIIYPVPDIGHTIQDAALWLLLGVWCLAETLRYARQYYSGSWYQFLSAIAAIGILVLWSPLVWASFVWMDQVQEVQRKVDGISQHARYMRIIESRPNDSSYFKDVVEVAAWVKKRQQGSDKLWVLSKDALIHFYSDTALFGEKERFLIYLLKRGRLNKDVFDTWVKKTYSEEVSNNPPRWIVDGIDSTAQILKQQLPFIETLIEENYCKKLKNRFFVVYEYCDTLPPHRT